MNTNYNEGLWDGMRATLEFLHREGLFHDLGWRFDERGVNQKYKLEDYLLKAAKKNW